MSISIFSVTLFVELGHLAHFNSLLFSIMDQYDIHLEYCILDMPPVKLVQCTRSECKTNETSGNVVLRHSGGDRPFWYIIIRIRNMIAVFLLFFVIDYGYKNIL